MKKQLEVGQVLYINKRAMFSRENSNLSKYIITKLNTKSVYVAKEDNLDYEIRLNKRTLLGKQGLDSFYQGFLEENGYWDMIKKKEEREELLNSIKKDMHLLTNEELKSIFKKIENKN